MRALVDAIAASILDEVTGANTWTIEKYVPMTRNPKKGKLLNIYSGDVTEDAKQHTVGDRWESQEIILEYGEPADQKRIDRDEAGEQAADDVTEALQDWSLSHQAGFAPAWKLEWKRTTPPSKTQRQFFVRYCRIILSASVVKAYTPE